MFAKWEKRVSLAIVLKSSSLTLFARMYEKKGRMREKKSEREIEGQREGEKTKTKQNNNKKKDVAHRRNKVVICLFSI